MLDMLNLSAHLPEVEFAAGDVVLREGQKLGAVWVLVSGTLEVRRGPVAVNTVHRPGAVVGEISVLLDRPHGATVVALEPTVLRHAADGAALLARHPDIARHLAIGLAERLDFITAYLADLKLQYGDAPGLGMVSEVLRDLAEHELTAARPGSARDPEPDY